MVTTYKAKVAPVPKGSFSDTIAYTRLDVVRYEGKSYIFKEAKAAGAWDAAKVMLLCSDGANGLNGDNGPTGDPGAGITGISAVDTNGEITITVG